MRVESQVRDCRGKTKTRGQGLPPVEGSHLPSSISPVYVSVVHEARDCCVKGKSSDSQHLDALQAFIQGHPDATRKWSSLGAAGVLCNLVDKTLFHSSSLR